MNRSDMTPRVTVRDTDDALVIVAALRLYGIIMNEDYEDQAQHPEANTRLLHAMQIKETAELCSLIEAVGDSFQGSKRNVVAEEVKTATHYFRRIKHDTQS